MTGVAVFKVDDVGRRPLLIGGVGGIVSIYSFLLVLINLYILRGKWRIHILKFSVQFHLTRTLNSSRILGTWLLVSLCMFHQACIPRFQLN